MSTAQNSVEEASVEGLDYTQIDPDGAQEIHDLARDTDPDHDVVGCWCCCVNCDFDYERVMDAGPADAPGGA